ncbi:hypothetical protein NE237_024008 [Protea cynaroides]|uniref:RNase H type-1 domain-containing protein n=1 Tax=Protea cynaroides TaxID=273540 RepID=A0A9Q0K506_9MAGN|nr:hypothetical protein NE237_024008 [Protea cynaroides]
MRREPSLVQKLTSCLFPLAILGEALGVRNGLDLAIRNGYMHSIIAYCQELVDILMGTIKANSSLCILFSSVHFQFIPRVANSVAHHLARKGVALSGRTDWSLSSPWLVSLCNSYKTFYPCSSVN